MKILLLSPRRNLQTRTNKGLMMPQLALFILQGLTPREHQVRIVEEEYMDVDLEEDCDLVGISCMTANSNRAYWLANEFRKRDKKVILGGVHPTILPDEALEHADAVVIGEAEGVWEQVLVDIQENSLKKRYHVPKPDITRHIPKNFSSLKSRRLFNIIPLMTTRGCPYDCEFCCVSDLYGKEIRHVPVKNIVQDIRDSGTKNFIFLDDNIMGHPRYAKELFQAIRPLRIHWIGQASISFVKDTELMQMAADSGCKVLFIGLETVSADHLKSMKKLPGQIHDVEVALKKIRKMGILVHASMIFGFDSDTKETFHQTFRFLTKNKISSASFNILTPYPGTKTFTEMKKSGRLITDNWEYYDHNTVVFTPKNMTPFELQLGKLDVRRDFYRWLCVFRRFWWNLSNPMIYLLTNIGHMKQVRVEARRIPELRNELFR